MLQLYIDLALSRLARHAIQPIQLYSYTRYTRYTAYSIIQRPSGSYNFLLILARRALARAGLANRLY